MKVRPGDLVLLSVELVGLDWRMAQALSRAVPGTIVALSTTTPRHRVVTP